MVLPVGREEAPLAGSAGVERVPGLQLPRTAAGVGDERLQLRPAQPCLARTSAHFAKGFPWCVLSFGVFWCHSRSASHSHYTLQLVATFA